MVSAGAAPSANVIVPRTTTRPFTRAKSAELSDAASQPLDARLNLDHVARPHRAVIADAFDTHEEGKPFTVFGLRQNQDGSDLRDRLGENCRRQRRRLSWLTRKVSLVERDVLDADDPFVRFELGDSIDQQKWISVGQDALNRRVVERQRKFGHGKAFSIIRRERMNVQPVRPPSDTELLSTLFDLGREVTSVLELEELLAKIPQLIARLTRFNAFSVYLVDDAREELRIAYAVGYPDGALATQRLRVGQGVVGAAVEEGRPFSSTTFAVSRAIRVRFATCSRSSRCRCGARVTSLAP